MCHISIKENNEEESSHGKVKREEFENKRVEYYDPQAATTTHLTEQVDILEQQAND